MGQAIGRCANLLNGDAFGAPTGGDFGILYPATTLAFKTYGNQPLWPAEVWEGQLDFVIFALLLIYRAFPHAKGKAFALYIGLYSFARFMLEFLRGDYASPVIWGLTSAQVTSLIAIIGAICLYIYCGIYHRLAPAAPPQTATKSVATPKGSKANGKRKK